MTVIWLNGTVGAGKSAVGQALAYMLPSAIFLDGDNYAGPSHLPNPVRWHMALQECCVRRLAGAFSRRLLWRIRWTGSDMRTSEPFAAGPIVRASS